MRSFSHTKGSIYFFEMFISLMIVWVNILALLDESKLDLGASLFEITMQTNHVVLKSQLMYHLVIQLWFTNIQ
jgi:hypothetical protein